MNLVTFEEQFKQVFGDTPKPKPKPEKGDKRGSKS